MTFATTNLYQRHGRFSMGLQHLARRIWMAWGIRRELKLLAEMEEHRLQDIGLTRSDVHSALRRQSTEARLTRYLV